jgi:hypothetical protein
MLMADTMAIFFVILGLSLAFPGLWLLCRGLWPRAAPGAAAICGKGLIKPFVAGLPVTMAMIFVVAVLSRFGSGGKIAAAATVCLYLIIANCGVAGLVTVIGENLASKVNSEPPWRVTLRGGAALMLASLLPILGWFVILPLAIIIGCGAILISFLRAVAAPAFRKHVIGPRGKTIGLEATTTLGAKQ